MEHIILNILIWSGLYLIVCLSLNIEFGFAGIPNFGRALAVLFGAFAVGGITNRILMLLLGINAGIVEGSGAVKGVMNEIISHNPAVGILILILSLLCASAIGALSGVMLILPSARLSEYYLAMTMLAISEGVFMVCYYNPVIMGGYYGVSTPDVISFIPGEHRLEVFSLITLVIALFIYFIVCWLLNTPYGRILRAMREDERVVSAYGKDVMMLRIKTCALGSAFASIAGALYSFYSTNVIASSFNRAEWTFYPFLMIILGGLGNNRGVIAGVLSFVVTKVLLSVYKWEITEFLHLPFEAVWLEYIIFGLLMILVLIYKPGGLIKEEPIMTRPIRKAMQQDQV